MSPKCPYCIDTGYLDPDEGIECEHCTPASRIRTLYTRAGLGQNEAARAIGCNQHRFRSYCRGRREPPSWVLDALEALS